MLTLTLFVCFVCYHPTRLGQLCQGLKCHWYACILFAFRTISVVFCYEVGWISLTKEMNVALSLKLSPGELKHANLILHFPRIQDQQSQQLPVAKALLQKKNLIIIKKRLQNTWSPGNRAVNVIALVQCPKKSPTEPNYYLAKRTMNNQCNILLM